jgi:hypothetical protein
VREFTELALNPFRAISASMSAWLAAVYSAAVSCRCGLSPSMRNARGFNPRATWSGTAGAKAMTWLHARLEMFVRRKSARPHWCSTQVSLEHRFRTLLFRVRAVSKGRFSETFDSHRWGTGSGGRS